MARTPTRSLMLRRAFAIATTLAFFVCVIVASFFSLSSLRLSVPADHPVSHTRQEVTFSSIKPSSTQITGDEWITVSWEAPESAITTGSGLFLCVQDAHCRISTDTNLWIGIFHTDDDISTIGPQAWATANPPWLATAPIKWQPAYTAAGSMAVFLELARENYKLALFGNGTNFPQLLATTEEIVLARTDMPQHIHLALTSNYDEMLVMWQSKQADGAPRVKYGTSPNALPNSVAATSETYAKSNLCGPPATTHGWREPGFFHHALITGLTEGQVVFYVVGSDAHGWSEVKRFHAPVKPSADANLNITAIADLGLSYLDQAQYHWMEPFAQYTVAGMANVWAPDSLFLAADDAGDLSPRVSSSSSPHPLPTFPPLSPSFSTPDALDYTSVVVHVGDVSYATGYASKWDRFMDQIQPIASRVPYMLGEGNHERDFPGSGDAWGGGDSGGECGIPTRTRFIMPFASQKGMWFSFNKGPVHFVMMDTEIAWGPGSEQYTFLDKDLSAVDRSVTPWVIFMGHRPMYYDNLIDPMFHNLEPLLVRTKVDLCLWGHVHNAQATCPVINGTCVDAAPGAYAAPIHAIIGNAGQSLSVFPEPRAVWSKYQATEFGYSSIEVRGSKQLTMRFFADNGQVLHYVFSIQRGSASE